MSDRHEQFCWWLAGFLNAQRMQGVPNLVTLDEIRAELTNALAGAQVQKIMEPGDGLTARTLESLSGPWSGGERVSGKHSKVAARTLESLDGPPLSFAGRLAETERRLKLLELGEISPSQCVPGLMTRVKSLEDKPRGVLVSAFDLLNSHVQKLEKRLYDLEQLPKPGETYREAFTRGWDNAKDKIASLSEHQGKQAREQGKLEGRIGELEAQLKKAQDMAGSMHDDKERRLKRLEVPDTQRHIRDLQRWQTGVNTKLTDLELKKLATSETVQNLNKRLHDLEQLVNPGHRPAPANSLPGVALRVLTLEGHADQQRQKTLDAAWMSQTNHQAAGLASALNNQAMSAELSKHRETFAPEKRTRGGMSEPHDPSWNANYDVRSFVSGEFAPRGIGDPEDRSGLGIRPEDITAAGGLHPKVRP